MVSPHGPRGRVWQSIRAHEDALARLSRVRRDPLLKVAAGIYLASQGLAEAAEVLGHYEAVRGYLVRSHQILTELAKDLKHQR